MPIIYGNGSLLVSLIWESANFASGNGATVLGFESIGILAEDLEAIGEGVGESWDNTLQSVTDNDFTLASVRLETAEASAEVPIGLAGSVNLNGPPSSVALIRYKAGAGKGRRNSGRNFWPGLLAESDVDERGVVLPARIATLSPSFELFFGQVTTLVTPDMVEAIPQSETEDTVTPAIVPWPEVITNGLRPIIGTQRRRVRP